MCWSVGKKVVASEAPLTTDLSEYDHSNSTVCSSSGSRSCSGYGSDEQEQTETAAESMAAVVLLGNGFMVFWRRTAAFEADATKRCISKKILCLLS